MTDREQEQRKRILVAAMGAFLETGYDKTSMDDIVRASGLSKGTLYWYFENKQMLFVALVEMVFKEFERVFDQIIAAVHDLSPPEKLHNVITGMGQSAIADPRVVGLYVDFFLQAWQYESVQKAMRRLYDRYLSLVSDIIQQGIEAGVFREVDARAAAQAIGGGIDGVVFQQILGADMDVQKPLALLADMAVRGLTRRA